MRITVRQLEIFTAVVEHGGFSAASEHVGMAQPAVSIAVRKLEESVGIRLLDRSSGRIRPTREGSVLLDHARLIRSQLKTLDQHMRELRSFDVGFIKIGAPPHLSSYFIAPIVNSFLTRHPSVTFSAVERSSKAVIQGVKSGEIDVGFIAGDHEMEGVHARIIKHEPLVACVPATSPLRSRKLLTWAEIFEQPLILFPEAYNQRIIVDKVATLKNATLNVVFESESGRLLTSMVSAGRGISVLFDVIVRDTDDVVAVPIADRPTVRVAICRREEAAYSLAAAMFYEECLALAEEL